MTRFDDAPLRGAVTSAELADTAAWIAGLQRPDGMILWNEGGHCDPWNHVETAMALDTMGLHERAVLAYRWLAGAQRADGSWHNYYLGDGSVKDPKLDTNVCAYVATGAWHHWLCTRDASFVAEMWPVVRRAIEWVLSMRRADGLVLWAREVDAAPWDYALLTGSSSIRHALHCGANLAAVAGLHQPEWRAVADHLDAAISGTAEVFEPKDRWAMDWYYPVLTGAVTGTDASSRLQRQWGEFVIEGRGVRCVSDEDWVTAAETAECALAHAVVGDRERALDLLSWTRAHRLESGAYLTGIVYPHRTVFPADEVSAYTGAAVILAADALAGSSPASALFGGLAVLD